MKGKFTNYLCLALTLLFSFGLSNSLTAQAWNPGTATPATNIDRSGNAEIGLTTTTLNSSTSNTKLQINGGDVSYGSHFSSRAQMTVDGASAEGSATSYGGRTLSWFSNGAMIGAQGSASVDRVRTTTPTRTGIGNGGRFTLSINDPIPSANANSGPYQIAGSVSQLSGNIATYPGTGFVSAVAGLDLIQGSQTWAGYFDGRGYFSGNVGVGTESPFAKMDVRGNVFSSPSTAPGFPSQFAAMGNSGGACDLYGFRAQLSTDLSINVGIENGNVPTISWANTSGNGDLDFDCDVNPGGCGDLIARMSCAGPYAMSVFGTGFFSGGTFTPSDRNLKSKINELKDPMDIIRALRGVTYTYNNEVYPEYKFPAAQQVGFIAQEVKEVIPEAVMVDRNGLHGVNYEMVIPYLVEGMQELDEQEQVENARITALENEVAELKEMIRDLCNNTGNDANLKSGQGSSSLNQGDVPVLFQNVPNPFNTSTKINYYLPENQGQGQVLVRDLTGNTVLSFVVEPGRGAVEVPASALAGGTYLYSLVVNGEAVATKRLSIAK